MSVWACNAKALFAWNEPFTTMPGGKPVMADPGQTPMSPVSKVGPVLVTVEPANTAKVFATPNPWALLTQHNTESTTDVIKSLIFITIHNASEQSLG